jgi:Tol biopolymer transport system component
MERHGKHAAATALIAVCLFAPAVATTGAQARAASTSRITPNANGATPATSVPDTTSPQLSLDGRWIAFSSDATNLTAGDTNRAADVFVKDLKTSRLTRASVTASGAQANGASYSPSLSVDGRWLAFASTATNLVSGDTNGFADIFLRDMTTGKINRLSVPTWGGQTDAASNDPFVSLFGDYVTFQSEASNLSTQDGNGVADAFVRDVRRAKTERVVAQAPSEDLALLPATAWSEHARISYDGRFLTYAAATRRNANTAPISLDVYLLDRKTRKTTHIYVPAWAGKTKEMAEQPTISADGRYVALTAWSSLTETDSVANQSDAGRQTKPFVANNDGLARNPLEFKRVWIYDRFTKTIYPVSSNPVPAAPAPNGDSYDPVLSANGHVVAFTSDATNLVAGDTNGVADVFVRDLEMRTASRMSVARAGAESRAASGRPTMSYDGRSVVFATAAALDSADTNSASDLYRRDRGPKGPDDAPRFTTSFGGTRGVSLAQDFTMRIAARDPDADSVRFGMLAACTPIGGKCAAGPPPDGASLDPVTGTFTWSVRPNQKTGYLLIVFWVQDPHGASTVDAMQFYVRDLRQSASCTALDDCVP